MFDETKLPNNAKLTLLARVLFTSLFLLSGVTHFTNIPYNVSLMPPAFPFPVGLTLISGAVELVGAAMILFNWHARLGGWLLVLFLVPVTLVVHGYELATQEDQIIWALQQAHFLKGIALTGAALLITQVGVTRSLVSTPAAKVQHLPQDPESAQSQYISRTRRVTGPT